VLTIRFVAVEGGYVTGELAAYREPRCECPAATAFRGRARGDVIEGSFTTLTAVGGPSHGHWTVRRQQD
jgi:hypothetical protein